MKFLTLADHTGFVEVSLFADAYRRFGHLTTHPVVAVTAHRGTLRQPQGGGVECALSAPAGSLTYSHIIDMVNHMKTTLNIDDSVMRLLKQEAARRGCTMSELIESALRLALTSKHRRPGLPRLPSFKSGGVLVDVADREALYQAMEGR